MATIKSKFAVGQEVVAVKSGKSCKVVGLYASASGVSVDAMAASSKRSWRFKESELMTVAEAAKAAKAKAKAAKPAKAPKVVKANLTTKPVAKAAKPKAEKKAKGAK